MTTTFYVHIVESMSPDELLDGETPGKALAEYLRHAGIPYQYNNAVDRKRLATALAERLTQAMNQWKRTPILHLGMHGGESGVQLTSQRDRGEIISWSELATLIRPIHSALPAGLGICMSSCKGIHGQGMAHSFDAGEIPFSWLVGFGSDVEWQDLSLAYTVFYRRYQKGLGGPALIQAVRHAAGINDFDVVEGTVAQRNYTSEMFARALQSLQQAPVPPQPGA